MSVQGTGMSGSDLQDQWLNLFVTQMRQQNPLEPINSEQTLSQLAQFTQVEQMTELNQNFEQVLGMMQVSDATGLLGKTVGYFDSNGGDTMRMMVPERVEVEDGQVYLVAGDDSVALSDVVIVQEA